MKQRFTKRVALGAFAALALVLTGCAGDANSDGASSEAPELSAEEVVERLGGQEAYDEFMALYQEAVDAGQTTVTIYGPEGVGLVETVQAEWKSLFPEITLVAEHINGAALVERVAAEATTGQGTGDVVSGGVPNVMAVQENLAEFAPFAGGEIGPEFRGPNGIVVTAQVPFAFAYNTNLVSEDQLPEVWSDLLESEWGDGRLSMADPTNPTPAAYMMNMMRVDGVWGEQDFAALAGNKPTLAPGNNINGPLNNTAQGQSAGDVPPSPSRPSRPRWMRERPLTWCSRWQRTPW